MNAQNLYNYREITGFVSGSDLHEIFGDLCDGDRSPSGHVEIPDEQIRVYFSKYYTHLLPPERVELLLSQEIPDPRDTIKIENGKLMYYGIGADGLRWYTLANASDEIANRFGYTDGMTIQEAFDADRLYVDDATGTPYVE